MIDEVGQGILKFKSWLRHCWAILPVHLSFVSVLAVERINGRSRWQRLGFLRDRTRGVLVRKNY